MNKKTNSSYKVYLPNRAKEILQEENEYKYSEIESSKSPAYLSINIKAMSINIFKDILSRYNLKLSSKLLELGGGYGYLSSYIKTIKPKTNITYSDPSEDAVKKSDQFEDFYGVKIDNKIVCAAEYLPFNNNEFSTIIMFSSFHHVQDPQRACNEISRVLSSKGKLLLIYEPSTPRVFAQRYKKHVERSGVEEKFYSIKQYRGFLKNAGLDSQIHFYTSPNFRWKKSSTIYYSLLSLLPKFVCRFVPCSVVIVASKIAV